MKNESFQGFTTFDFITMVFSLVVVIAVSAPIIEKNFQTDPSSEPKIKTARQDLSVISQAILHPENFRGAGRSVASVDENVATPKVDLKSLQSHLKAGEWEGEAGKDPWGNPYHFAFVRNKQGMPTHVAVWSDGPNQKAESAVHSQLADPSQTSFDGDDVGTIIPLR